MAKVHLSKLQKTYGYGATAVEVIHDISVNIADGEFVVMVGPSGCGKSTLLRMVAGLEEVTSGEIVIGARVVNQLEPKERDIAMVFQNYALYPHMSVYDNMAYGLRIRHLSKDEIDARVQKAAATLELSTLLQRTPRQLSGGQRQRVAMGRAIVREPAVFLFDEPLSNLDAKLRVQMRLELQRLHRTLGTTSLYVTHDQVEAMTLGQRLIVMNAGRAEQIGTPSEVYGRPASMFVAGFIGSPPMNLLRGQVSMDGGSFDAGEGALARLSGAAPQPAGRECVLGIRPEQLQLGQAGFSVEVEMVEALGADLLVYGRFGSQPLVVRAPAGTAVTTGERITAGFDVSALHWFDPQTTLRLA